MILPTRELSCFLEPRTQAAINAYCTQYDKVIGGTIQSPLYDTSNNWHPKNLFTLNAGNTADTPTQWDQRTGPEQTDLAAALLRFCQDSVFVGLPFSTPDELIYFEDETVSDDDVRDYGFCRFHDRTFTFLTNGHCIYFVEEGKVAETLNWLENGPDEDEDTNPSPPAFLITPTITSNHDAIAVEKDAAPLIALTKALA